jgi:PhnB protein
MKLIPYLHFTGQAEEALKFYQAALDGQIAMLSRYGDGPMDVAEADRNKVMHGRLVFGDNVLMISDVCDRPMTVGDAVALSINLVGDEAAAVRVFERLSEGGWVTMPPAQMFWGAWFGMLTDRFGIRWMINCELTS